MKTPTSIIISRTDNIGDVVLTLPMAGALKQTFPGVKISFIGKPYTQPVIACSSNVDFFLDKEKILAGEINLAGLQADVIIFVFPDKDLAKMAAQAGIPVRIGTSHRWYHWLYVNKLVNLGRKNSENHEAQLNLKLLAPLGIKKNYTFEEITSCYGFYTDKLTVTENIKQLLQKKQPGKYDIIIHPKSKGSAREWPLSHYLGLIKSLPKEKYNIWVTGSSAEGEKIRSENPVFFEETAAIDLTGRLSLTELIIFISKANALVACSTGPLHIAAAFGINALGIYPPMRPLHPGRWAPVGLRTKVFCVAKTCNDCAKTKDCFCINSISVSEVKNYLLSQSEK